MTRLRTTTADGVRIRDHLAAVRTLLAWHRAAVALLGIAVLISRIRGPHAITDNRALAVVLVAVALVVLPVAGRGLLHTRDRLETGAPPSRSGAALGALLLIGAGGIVVLVAVARAGG